LGIRALQRGAESVLEQVSVGLVPTVEAERISPVQRLHRIRKQAVGCFDNKVEVVWHEAIRKTLELVPNYDPFQTTEKVHTVRIEPEDLLAVASSRVEVVDLAGPELPWSARHESEGNGRLSRRPSSWKNVDCLGTRVLDKACV